MILGRTDASGGSTLFDLAAFAPRAAFGAARAVQRATIGAVGAGARLSGVAGAALVTRAEPVVVNVLRRAVDVIPIEAILARVDVDALVGQVDVDAIVRRVDVESLVTRLDLPRIVGEVLAEIEIGDLIQDSTTGIAADVRDSLRVQAIRVDGGLAGVIDRILLRRRGRDLSVPGLTPGFTT